MSKTTIMQYTVDEFAAQLTLHTQQTLNYLARHDYISKELYDQLTGSLVVVPIRNKRTFGRRLLDRFFGRGETDPSAVVFPIISVEEYHNCRKEVDYERDN